MSIRTKVLNLVDVVMRVPPILVIDELFKMRMGLPNRIYSDINFNKEEGLEPNPRVQNLTTDDSSSTTKELLEQVFQNTTDINVGGVLSSSFSVIMDELGKEANISNLLSFTSVKFIFCFFALLSAICIFMLWTRHLVMVYMFFISAGLTLLSYTSNVSALALMEKSPPLLEDLMTFNVTRLLDTGGIAISLIPYVVAQWFGGLLFAYIHLGPRHRLLQKSMPIIFVCPIFLATLPFPKDIVIHFPLIAVIPPLALTKIALVKSASEAGKTVYNGYQYTVNFISNFGLSALIENEWQRLNVPTVLRVFWTLRMSQIMVKLMWGNPVFFTTSNVIPTMQKLLVDGCETLPAVLGMTAVISKICHYIGKGFQWYLLTFDNDEEKSLGTVSAVLFYILALQTGLTSLTPEKRFIRLCRNFCLLMTALMHFLHNIVSPIMMSLSAARNPSRKRHLRALSVCAFLVIAPLTLLSTLWSRHSPSTWLLAVTAFSIEVIVKVLVSLATYTLFLLDARRQTFWERLDDYLYYVRAFGNSIEFCFGILLFFNGAWILLFESGGAIRAIMMCIHAYFNIWCEARAGWSVFMKRRSAVHKISALPEATTEQLRAFDDVCAICYQEMFSAKITRCRHFFHGVCLRKWLYVQDRCPLCHEIMMHTDRHEDSTQIAGVAPINQVNNAAPAAGQSINSAAAHLIAAASPPAAASPIINTTGHATIEAISSPAPLSTAEANTLRLSPTEPTPSGFPQNIQTGSPVNTAEANLLRLSQNGPPLSNTEANIFGFSQNRRTTND